jgi:hypothetical protein
LFINVSDVAGFYMVDKGQLMKTKASELLLASAVPLMV